MQLLPTPDKPPVPAKAPIAIVRNRKIAHYDHMVLPPEIDAFNVAHSSSYLAWFSGATSALFKVLGFPFARLEGGRVELRAARSQVAYVSSARLADVVNIAATNCYIERNLLIVGMRATRDNELLARAKITYAFIDMATGKLTGAPPSFADAVAAISQKSN